MLNCLLPLENRSRAARTQSVTQTCQGLLKIEFGDHRGAEWSSQHLLTPCPPPGGTAEPPKSHPSKASSFFSASLPTSHKARHKPQESSRVILSLPQLLEEKLFWGLVHPSLHPLAIPPWPWFATWRQINVIQAPLPSNISASRIPSHLPTDPCQQSKPRAWLMAKAEISVGWAEPPAETVAEESAWGSVILAKTAPKHTLSSEGASELCRELFHAALLWREELESSSPQNNSWGF